MSWKRKTPEELAAREAEIRAAMEGDQTSGLPRLLEPWEAAREEEERCHAAELERTPAGQARRALKRGLHLFQISLSLSRTSGSTVPLVGTISSTSDVEHASTLDAIEREGWRWSMRITCTASRAV